MDPSDISFPDAGGEMQHWWDSGVTPRGREGCGASIAMIIRRVRRHAMVWEPSRHPTTSPTPCRVERGCRDTPARIINKSYIFLPETFSPSGLDGHLGVLHSG